MPKLPVDSGDEVVRALGRLGFENVSQRGSHVKLRKEARTVIVPDAPRDRRGDPPVHPAAGWQRRRDARGRDGIAPGLASPSAPARDFPGGELEAERPPAPLDVTRETVMPQRS